MNADPLPLVTVVTPSFNQGRFIRETIESVLSQDYPRIEYIIMDGGSTDDTAAVVADYLDRLTFISEPDRGQTHAINKGFAMARGEIVAWLNSDDIFLPHAVSHAVAALAGDSTLGMVYGEGYQMDIDGKIISRFASTQAFDLWRLVYVSAYILQQTVFFRKAALDAIGPLDETLVYGMDWEIFMRLCKAFPVKYIPEYMGSIREYPTAKSFAGGGRRFQELAQIMRRHGARRFPPGYFVYGLTTYEPIWRAQIAARTPRFLERIGHRALALLTRTAHHIIRHNAHSAQGWFSDGWAARETHLMMPAPRGSFLILDISLPEWVPFDRQTLTCEAEGVTFAQESFGKGVFSIAIAVPRRHWDNTFEFTIRAASTFRPVEEGSHLKRRLAYLLHGVRYEPGVRTRASDLVVDREGLELHNVESPGPILPPASTRRR